MARAGTRAVVVGGGIGGLSAAIALRRIGVTVVVLERARELREIGAGISLFPNAINVLRDLDGVGHAIEKAGRPMGEGGLWTARGDRLTHDLAAEFPARFGAPLVMIHRATLQRLLRAALGDDHIRLDSEVASVDQDGRQCQVRLRGGGREVADLVIGADGLRSTVRAGVARDQPPRYSGLTAWRGVVQTPDAIRPYMRIGEAWGRGSVFGIAPLDTEHVYWWATAKAVDRAAQRPQLERAQLATRFDGWAPPVPELIRATPSDAIIRTGLYDRDPSSRWSTGQIALLGDAAHPMLPFLGQGACQAIEDAAVLADCLETVDDIPRALDLYAMRRYKRVSSIVRRSRQIGRLAHLGNTALAGSRNAITRMTPAGASLRQATPLLGYRVNAVGERR